MELAMELLVIHVLFAFTFQASGVESSAIPATLLTSNVTDRLALLAFKSLLKDPNGTLSSWENTTLHHCDWFGVACGRRHPDRVTELALISLNLDGPISPYIANLTFLESLFIPNNNLRGPIPPEIGRLRRLQELMLAANSLEGKIPATLTQLSSLLRISLRDNLLTGEIPRDIGSLYNMRALNLGMNNLTGTIPDSIGNMSLLFGITCQEAELEGSIPESLGKLRKLKVFQVYNNKLSGNIPSSFYNLSAMQVISIGNNQFTGTLPSDFFYSFPNLTRALLYENQFEGKIPNSISNASNLIEFDITMNGFSGKMPANLGSLVYLGWLNLDGNKLEAREDSDWSFFTSLMNCSFLQELGLENNNFGGNLPISIANLPPSLNHLRMGWNYISGGIPVAIGNLFNLTIFKLNDNNLTGAIPPAIGGLQQVHLLELQGNRFTGQIPHTIGNLTNLNQLHMQSNFLNGTVPSSFGNLKSLQELDLSQNQLSGAIPEQIVSLPSLATVLNLSHNYFTGLLPLKVSILKNLGTLDVSNNKLTGEIPSSLGDCQSLEYLYMEGNFFQGAIPQSLSNLKGMVELDLSRNNLSGEIPQSFQSLSSLTLLNLSFNNLEGAVPAEGVFRNASAVIVIGNEKLCGNGLNLSLSACYTKVPVRKDKDLALKVLIPILTAVLCIIIAVVVLAVLRWKKNRKRKPASELSIEDQFAKISYAELLRATDGFSSSNLIGVGSVGSVYKGLMVSNESAVAVKVLNLQIKGAWKSFIAECETLRHIRHRNLVKILTVCSSVDYRGNDFKALVLKYMPNGSLERWLHPDPVLDSGWRALSLLQRLNIAIDVASAIDYLHHLGQTPIVHCDLKPSNVLLDEEMCAHVGDFGLARFLSKEGSLSREQSTMSMGIRGTIGYVAPEYAMGGQASTHGDIYSYGILLLELFTAKRPTSDMFKDGLSLHKYVEAAFPERVMDIVDSGLILREDIQNAEGQIENRNTFGIEEQQCLISVIKIGLSCSSEDPRSRMETGNVIKEMNAARDAILGISKETNS